MSRAVLVLVLAAAAGLLLFLGLWVAIFDAMRGGA
jgi:hypothetical protein